MSLVRAERRRLFKRRFTRYMLIIAMLVLAAVAVGTFLTNEKVGPAQIAKAQAEADANYQETLRSVERYKKDCVRYNETTPPGNESDQNRPFPKDCEEIQPPPKEVAAELDWFMPPTFEFKKEFGDMITVLTALLALAGFIIGASYIGAEWNTGGMMNLLLWRPRRLQVLLTKLGTLLVSLFALFTTLGAIWVGVFWLIATYRGTTAKMTPGTWQSLGLTGLRGLAIVLMAAGVGFAVASIGRHTAMALGAAIGLIVVGQFGLGIALGIAQVPFIEAYLLPTYGYAWMSKKVVLENYDSCNFNSAQQECKPETFEITWQTSGLIFGISTVVLLTIAIWTMRRRDIT
jgi:ABC-2 type transport system permease protein